MSFRQKAAILSIVAAATLAACGGGGDDATTATAAPATAPVADSNNTPTNAVAATAPATNPASGAEATGSLTYAVLKQDGTSEVAPATSVYANPNGTLILYPDDAAKKITYTTTDDWANVNMAGSSISGAMRGSGNALLICNGSDSRVALSHNMVRVTDLAVLKGKTFESYECTATGVNKEVLVTFNADGTATDNSDKSILSAQVVAALFSNAGLTETNGSNENNYKFAAYSPAVIPNSQPPKTRPGGFFCDEFTREPHGLLTVGRSGCLPDIAGQGRRHTNFAPGRIGCFRGR